jgi:hypothetical protein
MDKKEIVEAIRAIIGGKKFEFSEAFTKKCKHNLTIGRQDRPYYAVTKKYVYCPCFAVYKYNEEADEMGYDIRKYPIVYSRYDGKNMNKLELENLFTSDLKKILENIKFFLWWETCVHKLEIQKELEKCEVYDKPYQKMKKILGE